MPIGIVGCVRNDANVARLTNGGKKLCPRAEKSSIFNWALNMNTDLGMGARRTSTSRGIAPTNQKTSLSGPPIGEPGMTRQ
jgi:hypothetical protein